MMNNKFSNLPARSKPDRKHAFYFAYGSNLNKGQMDLRCPAASPLTVVTLRDYKLLFCGRNRAGVATVEPCKGSNVIGGLWIITTDCLRALDVYEGFPYLYDRVALDVVDESGRVYNAITYYMVGEPPLSIPSEYYFAVIRQGYNDFKIPVQSIYDSLNGQYKLMARNG